MRTYKSIQQPQQIVTAHAVIQNLFNLSSHLVEAEHYRNTGNRFYSILRDTGKLPFGIPLKVRRVNIAKIGAKKRTL